MKRFLQAAVIAGALSVGGALNVNAQGIARMCDNLARPDAVHGTSARVTHHNTAAQALTVGDRNGRQSKIACYRIGLFLDNSQSAGASASAVASQFKELYPDVPCNVSYASPYFKVVAGAYIDHIDAVAMRGKLAAAFPKAVVVKDEIAASSIASYTAVRQKSATFEQNEENNAKDVDY